MASNETDIPADIRAPVDDYLHGTYEADRGRMERAFHPNAHIAGILGDRYLDEAAPDFVARIAAAESERSAGHEFRKCILSVEWTPDTASVSAENYVHGRRFIDYMHLIKLDGRWVIRNKLYTTSGEP